MRKFSFWLALCLLSFSSAQTPKGVVEVLDNKITLICSTAGGTVRTNVAVAGEPYVSCKLKLAINPSATWPGSRTFYIIRNHFGVDTGEGYPGTSLNLIPEPVQIVRSSALHSLELSASNMIVSPFIQPEPAEIFADVVICVASPRPGENPCLRYWISKRIDVLKGN